MMYPVHAGHIDLDKSYSYVWSFFFMHYFSYMEISEFLLRVLFQSLYKSLWAQTCNSTITFMIQFNEIQRL